MDFSAEQFMNIVIEYGPKVIGVFVALIVGRLVAGWASKATLKSLTARNFDATLSKFFANLVRWGILIGVVLGCLGVFGINTASFAAVLAAAGFAIGMAFQGTLGNFSAGVMLLVFRPFKIGDYVKIADQEGTCENIDLFTCDFRTLDNRKLIIPNGQIFGNTIVNLHGYDVRRVDINVGADYSADLDTTRKALEGALKEIPAMINSPEPEIFLKELGSSSINWQVRVWCKTPDFWECWQQATRATKRALDNNGIGIPFPQQDVHLDESVVKALASRN